MSDAPVDREDRPVMAAEVLHRAWPMLDDDDDRGVDALLACSDSGGPVVVGTDGTVRDWPRLTERERAEIEDFRGDAEMYEDDGMLAIVAILDRFAPPAQDAENQEDNDG